MKLVVILFIVYTLIFMLRNNTFFYCAMTIFVPFILYCLHKENENCFEKYKSRISFIC